MDVSLIMPSIFNSGFFTMLNRYLFEQRIPYTRKIGNKDSIMAGVIGMTVHDNDLLRKSVN